jgi:hypothetical protein
MYLIEKYRYISKNEICWQYQISIDNLDLYKFIPPRLKVCGIYTGIYKNTQEIAEYHLLPCYFKIVTE